MIENENYDNGCFFGRATHKRLIEHIEEYKIKQAEQSERNEKVSNALALFFEMKKTVDRIFWALIGTALAIIIFFSGTYFYSKESVKKQDVTEQLLMQINSELKKLHGLPPE